MKVHITSPGGRALVVFAREIGSDVTCKPQPGEMHRLEL